MTKRLMLCKEMFGAVPLHTHTQIEYVEFRITYVSSIQHSMRNEIKNKHSHAPIIMRIYNIILSHAYGTQLFKVNFCHETIII